MLNKLSDGIRECLGHAEECARKAAVQPDGSPLREDFLKLERRWLGLARSIEFADQLEDFSNTHRKLKG